MGATSGIGQAVMQELTDRGWEVGIAGRRQEQLIELQRINLNVVATERIDITQPDAADRLLTLIGKMGGDIDLYFHSSGIGYQNPTLDTDKEMRTVETNAMGFTRMVTAAYHYFAQRPDRQGHIAVISSIAGTRPLGAAPAYSSTKRYINHYMDCLQQLRRIQGLKHLCLTDIRPGFVRTPLLADGGNYPMQLDVKKVAKEIVNGLELRKSVITVDWKYRLLVMVWRLIPRCIWLRMRIVSKK